MRAGRRKLTREIEGAKDGEVSEDTKTIKQRQRPDEERFEVKQDTVEISAGAELNEKYSR